MHEKMTSSGVGSSLLELPAGVLTKIFSNLFSQDRKSVRLTCRSFYEACNTLAIHANEEFVLHNLDDYDLTKKIINSLLIIQRKVWNIRINCLGGCLDFYSPSRLVLMLFQEHGANISSLTLVDCEIATEALAMIIERSTSLRSLTVRCHTVRIDNLLESFTCLRKTNVIREKVTSLTLEDSVIAGNIPSITNEPLHSIFAVFPGIKRLEIIIKVSRSFNQFSTNASELTSNVQLTFSSFYHHLFKLQDQLEKLKLHFIDENELPQEYRSRNFADVGYSSASSDPFITHKKHFPGDIPYRLMVIKMKNLKKLSLNSTAIWTAAVRGNERVNTLYSLCKLLPFSVVPQNTSVTFPFSRFENLTEIECFIEDTMTISESAFVRLLLNSLKELRSLRLITGKRFRMDKECFQALVKSQLTTLSLYATFQSLGRTDFSTVFHRLDPSRFLDSVSIIADFEQSSLEDPLSPNNTLKHLRVGVLDYHVLLLFSTYFRCLDSLLVHRLEESILENILEYQINLRCLKLYNIDHRPYCSIRLDSLEEWSKRKNLASPHQLDHLIYLFIVENNGFSFELLEFLLDKFMFPKLKSLTIQIVGSIMNFNGDSLLRLLSKLTQLEHLEVQWEKSSSHQTCRNFLIEMLSKIKLLYCTIWDSDCLSVNDELYRNFLSISPSLRLLTLSGMWGKAIKYTRDPITGHISTSFPTCISDIYRGIPNYYCNKHA